MKKLFFILLLIPSLSFAQAAKDTTSEKTYLKWAYAAWSNKDYKSCIEDYTAALKINPDKPLYYSNRASAKWELKDYQAAITDLDTAISLNGQYTWIYYNQIGLINMDAKDYKGAIAAYSKSIELHPYEGTISNRANAELLNEDYAASIKDFTIAINENNKPKAKANHIYYLIAGNQYCLRGNAELLSGNTQKALSDLDSAILINPKLPRAYNTRGEAKNKFGDKAGACADWKTASDMGFEPAKENLKKYCDK